MIASAILVHIKWPKVEAWRGEYRFIQMVGREEVAILVDCHWTIRSVYFSSMCTL